MTLLTLLTLLMSNVVVWLLGALWGVHAAEIPLFKKHVQEIFEALHGWRMGVSGSGESVDVLVDERNHEKLLRLRKDHHQ